ncbi:hypothetical protein [Trinickia sp. Y13]|uniref:hypothetical protein n=1 Tax=Trinickia sp. Y13 TaxID=2917807 RepID=UPI0024056729|nr:hypothetical protein [Trinickia sp. Y13]MDG0024011.1 hypothetical protein [Trinickia sp. Y13]
MAVRRVRARGRVALVAAAAFGCLCSFAPPACAAQPRYAFAVMSGAIGSQADAPAAQRLLATIGLDARLSFVVYAGNLKGADEPCSDTLYERRLQWLQTSAVPLVLLPGQHDWADCTTPAAGRYDAAERLDFLRQTMFSDAVSLGRPTLSLTRESEVARFHAFRENVRWETGETVFVGLDIVGGNNHYSDAGGRNGEFDDRAIASAFWLQHAAEYAKRRAAKALVVLFEADPDFSRYEEHADRFAWLRFARHRKRDGYLEIKRSLVNAARIFRGPVIVIHHSAHSLPGGFTIDQPLYNDKGTRVDNLTRIAIAPRDASTQWVQFDVAFGHPAPFRVRVRTATTARATATSNSPSNDSWQAPASAPNASGALIGPLPGIQYVPPAPSLPRPAPAMPASEPPLLPEDPGSGAAASATAPLQGTAPTQQPTSDEPTPQEGPGSMQGGGP